MNLTFADICLLIGTLGINWKIGSYFFHKIKNINKDSDTKR